MNFSQPPRNKGLRSFLLFILLICYPALAFSQNVYFDWAKQIDRRTGSVEGYCIGVDDDKNVYLVGIYRVNIDVDPGAGVYNLTGDLNHVYVVKLDPLGNFVWGKSIGGDRFTNHTSSHVDPQGNVYICGTFSGTTDFDPGPGVYNRTATYTGSPENYDLFQMKLDKDGNFKWAQSAGSVNTDIATSIVTDAAGNVYTTGYFIGNVDFDPGPGTSALGSSGALNTFMTKFDNNGNFIWAKEFSGNGSNMGICIKTDIAGNIYLSGNFQGTVDFNPGTPQFNLTAVTESPYFAKLNASGNFVWAKSGIGNCMFQVDRNQEVIMDLGFAGGQGNLSKYDIDGNLKWSKLIGGRPSTWPFGNNSIVLDKFDNIYVTGEFHYTQDFDPGPGVYNMTCFDGGYNYDAFICRYDPEGNFVWAKQFGNFSEEHASSIDVDTSGNIYTTGIFNSQVDFDPDAGQFFMTAYTGGGTYIHKMSRCANSSYRSITASTCTSYTLNNQTYNQSGTYYQSLLNASGCDSIIALHLTIQRTENDITESACDIYYWNGQPITSSGLYTQTFTSVSGCDSLVRLNLTVKNRSTSTRVISICEGESYEGYNATGSYTDIFTAANGCDSIRTLQLSVIPKIYTEVNLKICSGETYQGHNNSGDYVDRFVSSLGCDSIRTLHLTVNQKYSNIVNKEICTGESYLGHTSTGSYTDIFHSVNGCDSIQTTHLRVQYKPLPSFSGDTTICLNDSVILYASAGNSYRWQNGSTSSYQVIKQSGNYSVTATNNCGTTISQKHIEVNNCIIYFPNAFTPNGDGKNDRFGILNAYNIQEYHLRIYNRWGEVVFESKNPTIGWDGTYKGILGTSVFVWQCSFKENGQNRYMKGTIAVIK